MFSDIKIPFNKPYLAGNELTYIAQAVSSGKLSGDGAFTKKCHKFFEDKYGFQKCLLTNSCTAALEMAAILIDIKEGDEVIMPSYTFVSTANAFALRGARIIFCDSRPDHPGMDESKIEELITPRTKAIVPVHYAGVACNMEVLMDIARRHNVFVIEDAAQAIESFYISGTGKKQPLGSFGHFAAFSFHETKNIISGEGGMLVINDAAFNERAEIIREKGTNRTKFFRGEVDKYGWVDIGSSFLPSEITAAFLYAQLESIDVIQERRRQIWFAYWEMLDTIINLGAIARPSIPAYSSNNAHMFYLVCKHPELRDVIISRLKSAGILSVFHYQSLHKSEYYRSKHGSRTLPNSDCYSENLIRLPLYFELKPEHLHLITANIISTIKEFGEIPHAVMAR
jgi:dTDP-4-amino-4,6-dideoxygalactose transaminase